ncbi:MAG: hypothetical protein AUJ36_02200 [Parcubacteria group bacterium CG1_02_41_26]|nr:MAG: hypothetical protein AUJ36_02200 [Parcubacteria group bacterium CG1_02_41_26]
MKIRKIVKREENIAEGPQGQRISYVCVRLANGEYRHGFAIDGEPYSWIKGQEKTKIDPAVQEKAVKQLLEKLGGERSC